MTNRPLNNLNQEEFFSEIRERIAFVVKKRIHSDDNEDIVQSTMVEIRSRIEEVKEESHVIPLVFEVLRNSIREYYQKKKREEKVLDFSTDALFYYQPEINEEGWKEITTKGIDRLQEEQPRCAELLRTILKSPTMQVAIQKMDMERLNIYRMLFRCRNGLLKVITENLKISLP